MKDRAKISDIVRAAMGIEEKGSHFYAALASITEDEKARQVFYKLAEEEKEHRRLFERLLSLPQEDEYLNEEVSSYLGAIIKGNVFPGPSTLKAFVDDIKSVRDALAIGIQAEKDAILLYSELLGMIKSDNASKLLYELLNEEKNHLVELRNYLEEL